jgi:hypothetical protein
VLRRFTADGVSPPRFKIKGTGRGQIEVTVEQQTTVSRIRYAATDIMVEPTSWNHHSFSRGKHSVSEKHPIVLFIEKYIFFLSGA